MKKVFLFLMLCALASADQGMTSAIHTANAGKIVFSDREIKFKKEDPSQLKSSFKLGDPIYGRLYFKQSMANTPMYHDQLGSELPPNSGRDGAWELLVYVDGVNQNMKFQNFAVGKVSERAEKDWTTWQLNLAPEQPNPDDRHITSPWVKTAARLKPGSHEIKLVFKATQGQYRTRPMAEGSFTLVIDEGASFTAGSFPKSSYNGTDLESLRDRMKSALVGPVAKSFDEIADVSVTSDWMEGYYTDTKVKYRKIQGTVLWADNDGDGVQRFTSYSFIQTRQGNGWSSLKWKAFVNGGPEGNVKK